MSSEQKLECILCKDVFDSKEELKVHFRKHGDPNFNQKSNRTEMSGEKPSENVEMVACDVCPEVFTTISKAITHKHKVHPDHDAKYFCPWCGKLFTMKHLYNKHMQSNHDDTKRAEDKCFHCDACDVNFYVPSAMTYHNKFFHRQDSDLPDIGHSKKIKLFNQEVVPIYYCAFCGEEYDNKVNLSKHVTDDHSDENQSPDEVLRCPLCDAIFYHLDAYEIHLTFHTVDDMYSVQNELFAELEDFSLETVPPVVEKVENLDSQDTAESVEAESTLNSVGIDKFLEIAMDTSQDSPVKVKKHKKHKKSKKPAITLDEFLNMNKDVFGEGLDFQGIEEVPTRAVAKRLKNVKKPATSKSVALKELAKLKKQGIVIKKKSDVAQPIQSNKILKGGHNNTIKFAKECIQTKVNPNTEITTSEDVLSKLISQSNNSIKIVKKSSQDKIKTVIENTPNTPPLDTRNVSKENILADTDENLKNIAPSVEETKDETNISKLNSHDTSMEAAAKPDSSFLKDSNHETEHASEKDYSDNEELSLDKHTNSNNLISSSKPLKMQNSLECSLNNLQKKGIIVVKPPRSSDSEKSNMIMSKSTDVDTKLHKHESKSDTDIDEINGGDHQQSKPMNEPEKDSSSNTNNKSLSALKGLSHLITVKPVNKVKSAMPSEDDDESENTYNAQSPPQMDTKAPIPLPPPAGMEINTIQQKPVADKDSTYDTLKNLSKMITIKPMSQSVNNKINIDRHESEDESDVEHDITLETKFKNFVDGNVNKNLMLKNTLPVKNEPNLANNLNSPKRNTQSSSPMNVSKITTENNANILKRLPNITTKPVVNKKTEKITTKQSITPQKLALEQNEHEIEIFNIDDSDDENDNEARSKQSEVQHHTTKSSDTLKSLSKNITIKSVNQKPVLKNIKTEIYTKFEEENFEEDHGPSTDGSDDDNFAVDKPNYMNTKYCSQKLSNKNATLKNALKNLGQNITIKSRNSSPSQYVKSQDNNTHDYNPDYNEAASDSDSCPGNVKITEMDEPASDEDTNTDGGVPHSSNAIVQSPDDTGSENDNEDLDDFEKEIKASTLHKTNQNVSSNPAILNTIKSIGKNITIKSLNEQTEKEDNDKIVQEIPGHLRKQLDIKPYKRPSTKEQQGEMSFNRNSKNVAQKQSSNQSLGQKVASVATSNQVNTVNKEVTVKTIQTKTVIQEITTTVTKTIKTVNQTMKQEIRNCSQTSSQMPTQRIQGIRPSQAKNLQGVIVRHAQLAGPRNVAPQMRPHGTVVRPSRQIVPMRTGSNTARLSTPRMPSVRKPAPNHRPQNTVLSKPLKISPNAMDSTTAIVKRAHSEDRTGPFSCFKKPKESLIPMAEVSNLGGGQSAQFASSSQTTSSNFSSTTKVVKGNCVMTSTQTKSEMSASAQQINRLSNTAGLKIVKTSQAQQMQTQEKSESNPMKRTTLAAIEKLQKQGLLVKKPRFDANEDSDNSDIEGDDNVEFSSADEHDE